MFKRKPLDLRVKVVAEGRGLPPVGTILDEENWGMFPGQASVYNMRGITDPINPKDWEKYGFAYFQVVEDNWADFNTWRHPAGQRLTFELPKYQREFEFAVKAAKAGQLRRIGEENGSPTDRSSGGRAGVAVAS